MLKLGVLGCTGKMGRHTLELALRDKNIKVVSALCSQNSSYNGKKISSLVNIDFEQDDIAISSSQVNALTGLDVVIDFSTPEATIASLPFCVENGIGMVIATTGFSNEQNAQITKAAKSIPVVLTANTSVGVNLCSKILEIVSKTLDSSYDIEITEAHHNRKVDAPSGTGLFFGDTIAAAKGSKLEDLAVYDRTGRVGPRKANEIGFSIVRAGDIPGEHTVMFVSDNEKIEIKHTSFNRDLFAEGAIKAAKWLVGKESGIYSMKEVLGIN